MFANYAQYYDLLNHQKNYKQEVDYIISLLNRYNPDGKNIIELGCGTGWHAIHLTEKGYQVSGIDQSSDMIEIAQINKNEQIKIIADRINFSTGDIRDYPVKKTYDVALSLFHVMSYQITNNDLNRVFQTVTKHLNPHGIFIFDCWYGPAVLSDRPYERNKKFENDKIIVNRVSTPKLYSKYNRVDVQFDIEIIDKQSGKTKNILENHKMRYLFQPEIELFLGINNLELIRSEKWLDSSEPNCESWYVTFICKRK